MNRYRIDESTLYQTWEYLHSIPEPGFREYKTAQWIYQKLLDSGISVCRLGETGILGRVDGRRSVPVIALRADMDALPFRQPDGTTVCRHACAHDAHCTMVLAAAAYYAEHGLETGTVYFLFQPGEETLHGAEAVLKCGLPRLDGMIGIHVRPQSEMEIGHATPALLHNASFPVTVHFHGKAAHGARPRLGINAVSAAARAVYATDHFVLDTDGDWSAKATVIDSHGNLRNVIPEYCSVSFDLRAETNESGRRLVEAVRKNAVDAAADVGCTVSFEEETGYAPLYDPRIVEVCRTAIVDILGAADPPCHTPGSEDFHAYSVVGHIPTAYIGLGARLEPGLHSFDMHFDHSCMITGAEILIDAVRIFCMNGVY